MLNHATAQIFVCLDPVDMRKSFERLAQVVRGGACQVGHMWLWPRSCLVLLSPLFRPSLHGGDVGPQIFHILALQVAQVDSHLGIVTLGTFG
jgi:hypothetical protein